jgi:hypothetical protein
MTIATIDNKSRTDFKLSKNSKKYWHPDDDAPLPIPEEETISHEEFREFFMKTVYERTGIKLDLPPIE